MRDTDRETLNRLGREWCAAGETADRTRLAEEIFLTAMGLFPKYADAMGEFFIRDWPAFDAEAGELYTFLSSRLKFRETDRGHRDRGERKVQTGEGGTAWQGSRSLDQPLGEEGEQTLLDQYDAAHPGEDADAELLYSETAVAFLTLALQFPERLSGRANNPQRLNYFRMFFTDSVVDILHRNLDSAPFAAHERELFLAVKTEFLDYFMEQLCRSVPALERGRVKPYGELVEGRPMTEPGHPLPNDVYMAYLKGVEGYPVKSPGTVSNQRKEYGRFLRESLC